MLGIKIRDTFISLYGDTRITFDEEHPMGLIVDALDSIRGGYSFPIEIPMDDVNRDILGHVDRLDHDTILLQDEYCEVWTMGVLFRVGTATVKASGRYRASLYIILHPAAVLTDKMLNALDLGGDRDLGADMTARLATANDTLDNPLDRDFIFAPVYNIGFLPHYDQDIVGYDENPQLFHQNYWTKSGDSGAIVLTTFAPITPFVRLDYLLSRIMADVGYHLNNQWQDTDELRQLLVWNNFNIQTFDGVSTHTWDQNINLQNHVPVVEALYMLKAVMGTFCLAMFWDNQEKVVELIPWRDLIAAPVQEDITSLASAGYGIGFESNKVISKFRYGLDESDELSVMHSVTQFPQNIVAGEGLTCRIMDAASEFLLRYSICDNTYYLIPIDIPGFSADYVSQDFKDVIKTTPSQEYTSPLIPLWNSNDIDRDGVYDPDLPIQEKQLATIRHIGFNQESFYPLAKAPCVNTRLFFYRGFQPYDEGISGTYPMTGITKYNIRGESVGDYALTMDREEGIYHQWWLHAYEMLSTGKRVTRELNFTIRHLLAFRWKYKYRIENQNYFITRMQYTLTMDGISPIAAEMITAP